MSAQMKRLNIADEKFSGKKGIWFLTCKTGQYSCRSHDWRSNLLCDKQSGVDCCGDFYGCCDQDGD